MSYAGGGRNSRGTQLIMAFEDNLGLVGVICPYVIIIELDKRRLFYTYADWSLD
jgi:hypothetical protein